ncbi:MAG TPA: hypothetical protein VMW35_02225 [Myxococcota bacterium]|jgi:hypothetical protein|nr:hypothetical protein [Myxococcota bacterium]
MKCPFALSKRGAAAAVWISWLMLAGAPTRAFAAAPAPLQGAVAKQFVQRTRSYGELRKSAVAGLPKLVETPSPVEISAREKAVAEAIRARRAGAKRGDVFGDAGPAIQALVRADWSQRPSAERKAAWAELPPVSAPAVNAPYPPTLPLATFPPELLTLLPQLPKSMEYRFAGPHLILRDVDANLVVDVLPDVLPGPGPAGATPRLGQDAGK